MPRFNFDTRNVNVRKQLGFLPAISEYTRFLDSYIRQQQNITDRQIALDKQITGQRIVNEFSSQLSEENDPVKLTKLLAEGITKGNEAGVSAEVTGILSNIADIRSRGLQQEQQVEFAKSFEAQQLQQFGDQEYLFNGEATKLKDILQDANFSQDPVIRKSQIETLQKDGKLTTTRKVTANESGDPVGGIFQLDQFGNVISSSRFVGADNVVYVDDGDGLFVEGKDVRADESVQAEFTKTRLILERQNRSQDRADRREENLNQARLNRINQGVKSVQLNEFQSNTRIAMSNLLDTLTKINSGIKKSDVSSVDANGTYVVPEQFFPVANKELARIVQKQVDNKELTEFENQFLEGYQLAVSKKQISDVALKQFEGIITEEQEEVPDSDGIITRVSPDGTVGYFIPGDPLPYFSKESALKKLGR